MPSRRIVGMNSHKTDVLILGGGVIGLSCAYYLLKAGRSVRVIDQGKVGCGSSHGNCGTLTPSHSTPLAMPGVIGTALKWMFDPAAPLRVKPRLDPRLWRWLATFATQCNWTRFQRSTALKSQFLLRSLELIEQVVQHERFDCDFRHQGSLYVYRDAARFAQSHWLPRALAEVGVPIDTLGAEQLMAREPALKSGVAGGYFHPADAHLRPDRYVAELARCVRAQGGEIEEYAEITVIDRAPGRVATVHTSRGSFSGAEVVMALGAWSPMLAAQLGLRLPIQPGKGYSITYSRPTLCPRVPLVLKEASVCVTAWDSGYRLGSTMEFAGYDRSLNRARLDALKRAAQRYLIEPEGAEIREEWYGWRPMTPDDLPIIGRVEGIDNLCLATGHGMLGVSMSAQTGVMVTELLCATTPSLDPQPYSPLRFR